MLTRVAVTIINSNTYLDKIISLLKEISNTHNIVFVQIISRVKHTIWTGEVRIWGSFRC